MEQREEVLALAAGIEQVFIEGLPREGVRVAWLQVATQIPDGSKVLSVELAVLVNGVWREAIDWRASSCGVEIRGVVQGWAYYAVPCTSLELRAAGERDRSLALCIQKLAWLVRLKNPDSEAAKGAISLLRRYGLLGSPMRAIEQKQEVSHVG